jgi:hypothetical protein
MQDFEKIELERRIREQIKQEQREYKAKWRSTHKDNIKRSNEKYRNKLKAMRDVMK